MEPKNPLRAYRADAGLSLRALAALAGVSERALAAWERGESEPRAVTLRRVARALGVAPAVLFRGDAPNDA